MINITSPLPSLPSETYTPSIKGRELVINDEYANRLEEKELTLDANYMGIISNDLSVEGLNKFFKYVSNKEVEIDALMLYGVTFDEESIMLLGSLSTTGLKYLTITNTNLSDDLFLLLSPVLDVMDGLVYIDIMSNELTEKSFSTLYKLYSSNTSLLDIRWDYGLYKESFLLFSAMIQKHDKQKEEMITMNEDWFTDDRIDIFSSLVSNFDMQSMKHVKLIISSTAYHQMDKIVDGLIKLYNHIEVFQVVSRGELDTDKVDILCKFLEKASLKKILLPNINISTSSLYKIIVAILIGPSESTISDVEFKCRTTEENRDEVFKYLMRFVQNSSVGNITVDGMYYTPSQYLELMQYIR